MINFAKYSKTFTELLNLMAPRENMPNIINNSYLDSGALRLMYNAQNNARNKFGC